MENFKRALVAACAPEISKAESEATCVALDSAFEKKGIGKHLLAFSAVSHKHATTKTKVKVPSCLEGELEKVGDNDWLAAYDFFHDQAQLNAMAGPFMSLCCVNLGKLEEADQLLRSPNDFKSPAAHLAAALVETAHFPRSERCARQGATARVRTPYSRFMLCYVLILVFFFNEYKY